ncbi:MAG: heme-dependent oxidative N-demethylase family protein [Candidatus Binataceae bacterium]
MSKIENRKAVPPMLGRHMRYPFADGNYSFGLGLAPMREETWLEIDDRYAAEMREKARRLRDEYDAVFLALLGSERGQAETLELLLQHLTAYYPDSFRISGRAAASDTADSFDPSGRIENLVNGETWRIADFVEAPLDLAARLVQEDLCLMSPGDTGTYVLSAGSVCFPFRWELSDKMGLPTAAIHHPVPGYDEKLAGPADRYMVELKPHKPSWRCNWNVVDAPDLHLKLGAPQSGIDRTITADNAGDKLWIRCERQTLRKLPKSGNVLFTIRTYIRPLSELAALPPVARGLSQALEKLPQSMRIYKSQLPIRAALLAYLERISSAPAP